MTPHILRIRLRSRSTLMRIGKGREGIRKGRGEWLRSIHDLRLLARPSQKRMAAFAASGRGGQ